MNVLKSLAVSAVLILGLAGAAMAQPGGEGNNTGCNGQGNPNSPCQGNGGQGGAGGTGIGIGVGVGHVEQKVGVKQDVDVTNVNANTNVNHNVAKQGQVQGQGQKQGQGQGQQQATSVNIEGDKVEVPASAPSVFTGSLVASPETCLGSFQAGGSGSNGLISLGLTFGKTFVDPDCTRRMYARSLMLLGGQYNVVAIALLAQDENVAAAFKAAGVTIPGQSAKAAPKIPDLKLNTPLGEPKSEEPKVEPKTSSLDIPAAMAATQAARVASIQGN